MPARQTRPCCQGARTSRAACLIASLLPPFFSSLPPIPLFIPLSSCSATSPNTRLSCRIDDKATMPGSNLPPPTWKGVHTFSSSAVIDAQIEAVWAVLLDFSAYPEWCVVQNVLLAYHMSRSGSTLPTLNIPVFAHLIAGTNSCTSESLFYPHTKLTILF